MTVEELIAALKCCPPGAEVAFAECHHHHLSVDMVQWEDGPRIALTSDGWTNDCKCEDNE